MPGDAGSRSSNGRHAQRNWSGTQPSTLSTRRAAAGAPDHPGGSSPAGAGLAIVAVLVLAAAGARRLRAPGERDP